MGPFAVSKGLRLPVLTYGWISRLLGIWYAPWGNIFLNLENPVAFKALAKKETLRYYPRTLFRAR